MGPSAIRITAEDFVTPPEYDGLKLATRSAGQIGGVRLQLVPSRDKLAFGRCYQQVPLRVLPPFHFHGEPPGLLYLLNPTAGLMDGDGHWIEIATEPGTKAVVTSQSATRMHPCPKNYSTQQWKLHVAPASQLVVLPGPAIPFCGARSFQRVDVELAAQARFIWADIWHPGRYDRGELSERFQFHSLIQELEVRRAGRLVYRDRFHWQGPWKDEAIRWHLGGHLACGSLFVTGPVDERILNSPESLEMAEISGGSEEEQRHTECAYYNGGEMAVMPLDSGDTCLRWVGSPAGVMHAVVGAALRLAAGWTQNANGTPWLLSSNGLAKNHWFSTWTDNHRG